MKKVLIALIGCAAMFMGTSSAQEVVITDFPVGVAGSIDRATLQPHLSKLQAIADSLNAYPLARAIVTGGADGESYRRDNDAKNPGLALGRAHLLRNLLVFELGVDSAQIVLRTREVDTKGPQYRFAGVRIDWEMVEMDRRLHAMESRPLEPEPAVAVADTPATYNVIEDLGLQLGTGITTSPFGAMPVLTSAIAWKQTVYVEGTFGYTFWNNSFRFQDVDLNTKRRFIGGQVIVYPWKNADVGFVGGWARVEQVSNQFYKYVKLSEGPVIGMRVTPYDFLSITGLYNPAKQRHAGDVLARSENDQFLLSATVHFLLGGRK